MAGKTAYKCQPRRQLCVGSASPLGGQQLAKRFFRSPLPVVPAIRCRVRINESDQYLSDDPTTNVTETVTSCTDVGFAENVVPQRSVALPTRGRDANLLRSEGDDADVTRDGLARW